MKITNAVLVLCGLVLMLIAAGCSLPVSEIQASWHDPQYKGGAMKGLLVILVTGDHLKKKSFEDDIGGLLRQRGVKAVAGYKALPSDQKIDEEFVRSCIVGLDTDAILVSRILGVETEKQYVPGYVISEIDYGSRFSSYYVNSYRTRTYQVPSTTYETETILIDNRLYRCDQDENMVWQMQLKVTDIKPFDKVVEQVGDVILRDLSSNGML